MHFIVITHTFIKEFIAHIKKDPIQDWSATLAFFFMLSIFPLLIFILALLPYLPIDANHMFSYVEEYVPYELANLLSTTIFNIIEEPKGGLLSFGILATIWTASNGMNALIRALNKAHDIDETRSFIKVRLLSIIMTLGMVLVIIVTLLLPIFGRLILQAIDSLVVMPSSLFETLNRLRWIIGITIMTLVLMLIYYIAPNKRTKFSQVVVGAIFATITWQMISYLFSIYVSNFGNYSATYGSLGGVIILMLWFFLSGMILVIGGEINATLENIRRKL